MNQNSYTLTFKRFINLHINDVTCLGHWVSFYVKGLFTYTVDFIYLLNNLRPFLNFLILSFNFASDVFHNIALLFLFYKVFINFLRMSAMYLDNIHSFLPLPPRSSTPFLPTPPHAFPHPLPIMSSLCQPSRAMRSALECGQYTKGHTSNEN